MWSEFAPAKINLSLHITGKRADGYHTLQSVVAFANCGDIVRAERADKTSFHLEGEFAKALAENDEYNLVLKALRSVEALIGKSLNLHITLEKNLPVASGIGGGSADAAAMLRLLKSMLQDELPDNALYDIALSLGSDVPVCLAPKPTWMGGIGELLEPINDMPNYGVVLMNPLKALATKDVFAAHTAKRMFTSTKPECASKEEFTTYIKTRKNSLQAAAVSLMPEIETMIHAIAASHGCLLARMSGSGATCFGLYDSQDIADQAAAQLATQFPSYWIKSASFMMRENL